MGGSFHCYVSSPEGIGEPPKTGDSSFSNLEAAMSFGGYPIFINLSDTSIWGGADVGCHIEADLLVVGL